MDCTPIVIYPGWYVDVRRPPRSVVVRNDTYFAKWLPDRPKRLDEGEVRFLAARMRHYQLEKRERN